MKEAKPIIDIDKDIITFFNMISTGYYLMEVQDWKKKYDCEGNLENMALVDEWDRMDNNYNEWKVIPRLDNKGEVSREQVYPHIDNKTREQTSAADDTADMADSDVETGLELDYKGEVPRVQVAPHGNGKARGQRSAAVVTADTADGNHDPDLEPYVGPVDRRSAARPAGSDADRDTQYALPAAHQPVGQAVDDAKETLMQMRIPRQSTWKPPTVLKLSLTLNIKASVRTKSVICSDPSRTYQDPRA